MSPELCLGTAQFGMHYGITNKSGQIDQKEINAIIKNAYTNKILFLDTAQNYGDAEIRIGKTNLIKNKFKVINKFSHQRNIDFGYKTLINWENYLKKSLNALKISNFDSFLIHSTKDLSKKNIFFLLDWMESLKEKSIIKRIGVSIYEQKEIDKLPLYKIDLIQLPLSIYDQRFLINGSINKLSAEGIAIHIRSIFLQGLILQAVENWPDFLSSEFKNHHRNIQLDLKKRNYSMLETVLRFSNSFKNIEAILFGITSNQELITILETWNTIKNNKNNKFLINDLNLQWNNYKDIDPREWPK